MEKIDISNPSPAHHGSAAWTQNESAFEWSLSGEKEVLWQQLKIL